MLSSPQAAAALPKQMPALLLTEYGQPLTVGVKPVPQPGPGEVLVQMAASPINPSDLMFLRGLYGVRKPLPAVPGFEGSGIVVAAGSGWMARRLLGKRVACIAPNDGDGTWAAYMKTGARFCMPLIDAVSLQQGAMLVVNPWTAWALFQIAKKNHAAAIHTAAASALGRMLLRLAQQAGYPIIHVVRRDAQVDLLRRLGADHVLNSSSDNFPQALKEMAGKLNATIAFDAVAGETTGQLGAAMPKKSRIVVYGGLSEQMCAVDPGQLIFSGIRLEGFWLSQWVAGQHPLRLLRTVKQIQRMLGAEMQSEVREAVSLENAPAALQRYAAEMTGGKVLITPDAQLLHDS